MLVLKEINYINNKKATPFNTIPSECSADTLTSLINKSLTVWKKNSSNFKLSVITLICKKNDLQAKEN